MSLYIKTPEHVNQRMLAEAMIEILHRDYKIQGYTMISNGQTRHYFIPIPEDIEPQKKLHCWRL